MAMAFHEITKIQARKKMAPAVFGIGVVEARDVRPVEAADGLNTGRRPAG